MQTRYRHSHEHEAIARRLADGHQVSYIRDFVYGGIDGAITTFAIVAGVVGADLSHKVILALGFANLFADGFSMAAGNYSGVRAARDEADMIIDTENRHIDQSPEGEREEVRQLLARQGMSGDVLESAVKAVTADKKRWVSFMLTHEYGIAETQPDPLRAAFATFLAFVLCGFVPIAPYLFALDSAHQWSFFATACVFLLIGALKSQWSVRRWWVSALETLCIGTTAALVAYAIGILMGELL